MFNKPKDATDVPTTAAVNLTPTAAPIQPQQQPVKRSSATRAAPSIISADLVVTGTLSSTGDMQVDGRVEGDVHSAALVVGEKAVIQGEIIAEEVTVRGRVEGSIRARKILLCSTCHVEGNILHEAFSVEAGAFFEGNCRHSDNPTADESGRRRSTTASLSTSANGGATMAAKGLDSAQARPAAAVAAPAA